MDISFWLLATKDGYICAWKDSTSLLYLCLKRLHQARTLWWNSKAPKYLFYFILCNFFLWWAGFHSVKACFKSRYNLRPDVNMLCWAFIQRKDLSFHLYNILTKYLQIFLLKYLHICCLTLFYCFILYFFPLLPMVWSDFYFWWLDSFLKCHI